MGDFNSNNNDAFNRSRDAAAVQARTKAQTRASVLQLKLIGQSHPTGLTNNLLKLFEPRAPLEYKPPPEKRKCPSYTGMAQFVGKFAEPGDDEYSPPVKEGETAVQRRARVHKLRLEEGAKKAADELEKYDPSNDPNVMGDPYKTLFVARLNYETTEHRIKREFESYGTIKRVRMITDKESNKPRGYAFIEYAHTRDMKAAYKQADGRKLDNKRVLVDVERGRTVPNWRPRRLGGGLGSTRVGGEEVNQKYSGREPQQIASGGPSRSEEPRNREERHVDRDREKSRERGRDKDVEHEKPRERSHDRPRDRESREDRHRDRNRDRDRGRDHDRTRDRNRDRVRDSERDQDRERDRDRRDRPRDKDRDHERDDSEVEGVRSRDKDSDYDRVESKHKRSRHSERDRDTERETGHGYDHLEPQGDRDRYDAEQDRYDQMEPENYEDVRATSESRERERTRDYGRDYEQ
ncbi:hypothetical protein MKW98_027203 [Papaver atlanticum]|uniref:RRM domain-containing protein n=1 Tax=Papaver atlanticum TaxID=357466 RepID=A0AAD4SET7_9MAGN|nr:hypothetical protein MKW98_027203 [Papaver atlanticum]